jgi:hypothetical protein
MWSDVAEKTRPFVNELNLFLPQITWIVDSQCCLAVLGTRFLLSSLQVEGCSWWKTGGGGREREERKDRTLTGDNKIGRLRPGVKFKVQLISSRHYPSQKFRSCKKCCIPMYQPDLAENVHYPCDFWVM